MSKDQAFRGVFQHPPKVKLLGSYGSGGGALKRMLFGFVLLVSAALPWPQSARAQSAELTEARRQGTALYQAGKFAEAVPHFEKVALLAEREFGLEHANTASPLAWLAVAYTAQGRYPEAEPLYKCALAIDEKSLGPEHPSTRTWPSPSTT